MTTTAPANRVSMICIFKCNTVVELQPEIERLNQ